MFSDYDVLCKSPKYNISLTLFQDFILLLSMTVFKYLNAVVDHNTHYLTHW